MTRFIDLLESGQPGAPSEDERGAVEATRVVIRRVQEEGLLKTEDAWRLHRAEARSLLEDAGHTPPGGWRAHCALLGGTGILRVKEDRYLAGPYIDDDWVGDEVALRARMVEAFTRYLIPPAAAAGLFLAMGVHPLWGLRLARRLHIDGAFLDVMEGFRDDDLLPEENLSELRKGVFAALSVVVSALRRLDSEARYSTEALTGLIGEALTYGAGQIEDAEEGLPVIIGGVCDEVVSDRTRELAAREILEALLVPSRLIRRFDDGTFSVAGSVLHRLRVGHLGPDAQRTWLQCYLVDRSGVLVA
jgi:hypothetical protein